MKAVSTAQIRQLDAAAIAAGTPGYELMERAGLAVARCAASLLQRHGGRTVLLIAGKGNNGGDAIVAARHLAAAGMAPVLVLLGRREELSGDPAAHFRQLTAAVQVIEAASADQLRQVATATDPAVVVDGVLGTGLTGEVREPHATAIRLINSLHRPTIAVDIPSGLDSDSGAVHGVAVQADITVTMGLPKIGLLQPSATDYVGRIEVADLGFPDTAVREVSSDVELLTATDLRWLLPRRRRSAHKGDFGHLLIVAGAEGYTGAPVMCAHAAARSGAGLVSVAAPRAIYPIVAAQCPPEVMPQPVDVDSLTAEVLAGYDAVAIGPGLGRSAEARSLVWRVLTHARCPVVVDADGLYALTDALDALAKLRRSLVLTPHPGEMGRLIGLSAAAVQQDRWGVARRFAAQQHAMVVLKGAGTVVTDGGTLWINNTGNPGMARGGMGDALTGIIGALLAQRLAPLDAARVGVFVHGLAGDLACEQQGEQALLVSDLIAALAAAFKAVA